MSFIDVLRKLGILRYGAKSGTFTNATNRPTEFQMDGVYNADKDLVTKQDVKNVVAAVTGKPAGKKGCLTFALVGLGFLIVIIVLGIIGASGDGTTSEPSSAEVTGSHTNAELTAVSKEQPAESPLKDWNPKTAEESLAGPAGLTYEKYVNRKFGFVAELPAHWESALKNNSLIFCGAKGTEEHDTTVNFQIINKKPGSTVRSEADDLLAQWKTLEVFNLDKMDQGDLNGHQASYMVASYELPGGQAFQQMQAVIERDPYYYMIGYTAPKALFMKYYFVMIHLIGTFQFTEIPE